MKLGQAVTLVICTRKLSGKNFSCGGKYSGLIEMINKIQLCRTIYCSVVP